MMKKSFFALLLLLFCTVTDLSHASLNAEAPDNWDGIENDISKFLSLYLMINTTNPPGNENKACLFLKSILLRNGINSEIIESSNGGYNLVSVIRGDGSKKPLLLLNHTDVSPTLENDWELPPFAGKVKDGLIYGRGALETKGMAIIELFAFMEAKKKGLKLKRDLIYLASSDRHTDKSSAEWITKERVLKETPEYVLGGGSFGVLGVLGNAIPTYLVSNSEKAFLDIELSIMIPANKYFEGPSNSLLSISKLLELLKRSTDPLSLKPDDIQFLKIVSQRDNPLRRFILAHLDSQLFWNRFKSIILDDPIISGSIGPSLIPQSIHFKDMYGEKSLSIRAWITIDESDLKMFSSRLKKYLSELGIDLISIRIMSKKGPSKSPVGNEFYEKLKGSITLVDPKVSVAPYSTSNPTDLRYFRDAGTIAYGLVPLVLPREVYFSAGNVNERIPIKGLGKASRIIFETIKSLNE